MEFVDSARYAFALTASFHFIFVPLSIGLALLVALMELRAWRSSELAWRDAARFFNKFFFLTWLIGVITGFPLRWQLTHLWPGYQSFCQDVFGRVAQFEAGLAPAMIGLVLLQRFGWRWLNRPLHLLVSAAVFACLCTQGASILIVNAWMQQPVGVEVVDGQAKVADLAAIVFNPVALDKIVHTIAASLITGCLFVAALAAARSRGSGHDGISRRVVHLAAVTGLLATLTVIAAGHSSARHIATAQPIKFAAFEAYWDTVPAPAPLTLLAIPDAASRSNRLAIEVPWGLSLLAYHRLDQSPPGLNQLLAQEAGRHPGIAPGKLLPNVPLVFWSFRVMVGAGVALLALFWVAAWVTRRQGSSISPRLRRLLFVALPLPWLAIFAGWIVAEVGRQPWAVYGLLATDQAAARHLSPLGATAFAGLGMACAVLAAVFVVASAQVLRRRPPRRPLPEKVVDLRRFQARPAQ